MLIDIPEDCPNKLDYVKIQLTLLALEKCHYRLGDTTKFIGISRRALRYWMSKYKELHSFRGGIHQLNLPENEKEKGYMVYD